MKAWKLSPIAIAMLSLNANALEPVGLGLGGGLTLLPSVDLSVENNSNIYSQPEDETSATISRLTPALAVNGDFGAFTFDSYYQAEQGSYSEDSNDDYLDQYLTAGGQYEFNARHELALTASFNSAHDARGSGTAEGAQALAIEDPDQYQETTGAVNYVYGTDTSAANLELFADSYQKRYTNNDEFGTETRDHDKVTVGARLIGNASNTTKVIFEAKETGIAYSEDSVVANAREGKLQTMMAGLRWDISGKTTGEVKLGRAVRYFDEETLNSNLRVNWEANIVWNPLTYSEVAFVSAQTNNETNGAGTYIASTSSTLSWNHEFTSLFSAGISGTLTGDAYVDDVDGREDETVSYGLNATYSAMPWMDIRADYSQSNKDSNIDGLDSDTQIVSLAIQLAL